MPLLDQTKVHASSVLILLTEQMSLHISKQSMKVMIGAPLSLHGYWPLIELSSMNTFF